MNTLLAACRFHQQRLCDHVRKHRRFCAVAEHPAHAIVIGFEIMEWHTAFVIAGSVAIVVLILAWVSETGEE